MAVLICTKCRNSGCLYKVLSDAGSEISKKEDISFGYRPCSVNGLPYIGRVKNAANLVVATGHSMMGLSFGPATGKLVSEIINGEKHTLDVHPFDPHR